jgi:hypothetical protein
LSLPTVCLSHFIITLPQPSTTPVLFIWHVGASGWT